MQIKGAMLKELLKTKRRKNRNILGIKWIIKTTYKLLFGVMEILGNEISVT